MSNLEKLMALGAQPVAGDLVWKHKVLGQFRNGDFAISPDGIAALDVEDVEVKPVRAKPLKIEKAEKPAKKLVVPDEIEDVEPLTPAESSLEDLLGD